MSARGPAAVLFGAERTGLTNEELALAHLLIRIPANPEYPSLNLAMAVQLVCYELFRAAGSPASVAAAVRIARAARARRGHGAFLRAPAAKSWKKSISAIAPQSGTHLMTRIRRLFQRCEMDQNEVNILRGILTAVQSKRRRGRQSA